MFLINTRTNQLMSITTPFISNLGYPAISLFMPRVSFCVLRYYNRFFFSMNQLAILHILFKKKKHIIWFELEITCEGKTQYSITMIMCKFFCTQLLCIRIFWHRQFWVMKKLFLDQLKCPRLLLQAKCFFKLWMGFLPLYILMWQKPNFFLKILFLRAWKISF